MKHIWLSLTTGLSLALSAAEPVDMVARAQELKNLHWGMFICWSFSTFSGKEWTPGVKDVSFFKATEVDTEQWARTAKEAGMGYILFLTRHHDGFCLWDTKTTARKVTNAPLKRDVLAELRKSCDKYRIKLALYFSEGEFNDNKDYHPGGYTPEMKRAQLEELLTQYGPIEYIWFDTAQGDGNMGHKETVAWCKSFQPGCFIGFNHGDQTGCDIRIGEMGHPGPLSDPKAGGISSGKPVESYLLAEFTYPILPGHKGGAQWFYSLPKHDNLCLPPDKLYADYVGAVKYGNIFSIDVGPNYEGKLRAIDVKTLKQVGEMIRNPPPVAAHAAPAADAKKPYYTEPPLYQLRPNPDQEEIIFGSVGVSGLLIKFRKGVVATVDRILTNTPADGKFTTGQIITGVNGVTFIGRNPIPILGEALTTAEATDGALVFDVKDNEQAPEKQVKISIPVLGSYGATWPLNSEKSKRIVKDAATFYSTNRKLLNSKDSEELTGSALACLFLLSTGDDAYLPCVKKYFESFLPDVTKIGHHTWNNGYNGIACAEYYLRTGDTNVLPILQYYCDDAALRQSFGCGWNHWGFVPGPWYVAGGLLNAAGAQVLTSLLLAKECGVNVDEKTLLGSLRFFYRFAGRGTVPYGDHRGEGGLGSNGKDGMIAAAMQVASGAEGNPPLYTMARNHLGMSMLESYPVMILGHGDEGRGDAIWRSIAPAYIRDVKPALYHDAMNRLAWYYDLCRRPSGGFGMAACPEFDDDGSGAGVALAYTAPLKTLRITGAPASKHAKKFTLPAHLWGTAADAAFLSIEKNPAYASYGTNEPIHIPFFALGCAYAKPQADLKALPKKETVKNVYHDSYVIRTQAAKALRTVGQFGELEKMLDDPDLRVRRAALDGMTDYNYWFGMGDDPIAQKDFSPKMVASIKKMLSDKNESWWVIDGALMALNRAPVTAINEMIPLIMPWLKHEDWWLRESAFMALLGLRTDTNSFPKVLPAMMDMVTKEYHTMPREKCLNALGSLLDEKANPVGPQVLAGLLNAVETTEIKPDRGAFILSAEGSYNTKATINTYLQKMPEMGLQTAEMMSKRLAAFAPMDIVGLIGSPAATPEGKPQGLYASLDTLNPNQREKLADILYTDYRLELIQRLKTMTDDREAVINAIIDLLHLKHQDANWHALGDTKPADRTWRYLPIAPLPKDVLGPWEKRRFRDITLPQRIEKWYEPEFDDRAWKAGKAPIGSGIFKGENGKTVASMSKWGTGEFLLMRTTFKLEDVDYDFVRIRALMKQGYRIYLNGHEMYTYIWWEGNPFYQSIMLGPEQIKLLKKGVNVLAVYCNLEYRTSIGQADVFLEGLKVTDLMKEGR